MKHHGGPPVSVDMDRVDRELAKRDLNPYRFAREAGIDASVAYKVLNRERRPTAGFILALLKIGIPLELIQAREPQAR